jgi:prenyltransferase beta subunit
VPLLTPGTRQFEALLAFLVSRQTAKLDDDEPEDEVLDEIPGASLDEKIHTLPDIPPLDGDAISCAGFNGRCNKVADTCYSFWNEASLLVGNPCSHMWLSADSHRCWID